MAGRRDMLTPNPPRYATPPQWKPKRKGGNKKTNLSGPNFRIIYVSFPQITNTTGVYRSRHTYFKSAILKLIIRHGPVQPPTPKHPVKKILLTKSLSRCYPPLALLLLIEKRKRILQFQGPKRGFWGNKQTSKYYMLRL